jgi:hypothetical protein
VPQIGGQGGLRWLLLDLSAEVGAAKSSVKPLLLAPEEVFDGVVRARDDGRDGAGLVTAGRVTNQQVAVAIEVL